MKLILCLLLVIGGTLSFAQPTKVNFSMVSGRPKSDVPLTGLKPPLDLHFTSAFGDKEVRIMDAAGTQVLALNGVKFGDDALTANGDDGSFSIGINEFGVLDAGDGETVNATSFKLMVAGVPFDLSVSQPWRSQDVSSTAVATEEYTPGYLYYDAIKLSSSTSPTEIQGILKAYGVTGGNLAQNIYLQEFYKPAFDANIPEGLVSGFLGTVGNMNVTPIASVVARTIAERAKEELNEAFFRRMKEKLNAYPELSTIFPKTTEFLNVIETYSYASVLQVLKEAFETDVSNMAENVYRVKELTAEKCKGRSLSKGDSTACDKRLEALDKFFDTREGLWTGLGMLTVKEAIGASDPATLLSTMATSDELKTLREKCISDGTFTETNVTSSIQLLDFLSESLRSQDEDRVWISSAELKKLFKDEKTIKTYLGLLLAKELKGDNVITFYENRASTVTFGTLLKDLHGRATDATSLIRDVHTAFNATNGAVGRIVAAGEHAEESDAQALYQYYRTFVNALRPIAQNKIFKELTGVQIDTTFNRVVRVLDPAVDLAYHVATERYGAAIYDATLLLNGIHPNTFDPQVSKAFLKYGTTIGGIATAKTSDEMKKALEAAILPVGSSAIKRNSAGSISLNTYVGGFYGWSWTNGTDTVRNEITNALDTVTKTMQLKSYGLFAPIGITFAQGSIKARGGFGLTLQVFDLGALVNFYLLEGDKTALPEDFTVRLSNIFAPGLQLGYNIPNTPLTVGGGLQFVPALYKVGQITSSEEIVANNAWRGQFSVTMDLPLLNLHVWDFKK